jgi:hypothetical protein
MNFSLDLLPFAVGMVIHEREQNDPLCLFLHFLFTLQNQKIKWKKETQRKAVQNKFQIKKIPSLHLLQIFSFKMKGKKCNTCSGLRHVSCMNYCAYFSWENEHKFNQFNTEIAARNQTFSSHNNNDLLSSLNQPLLSHNGISFHLKLLILWAMDLTNIMIMFSLEISSFL